MSKRKKTNIKFIPNLCMRFYTIGEYYQMTEVQNDKKKINPYK